jgi:hypothetical protein
MQKMKVRTITPIQNEKEGKKNPGQTHGWHGPKPIVTRLETHCDPSQNLFLMHQNSILDLKLKPRGRRLNI